MKVPARAVAAGGAPQRADVRAGVGGRLVEAHAGHRAGDVGGELHAEHDRARVAGVDHARAWRTRRSRPCGVTAFEAPDAGPGPGAVRRGDLERVGGAVGQPGDAASSSSSAPTSTGVCAVAPDERRHGVAGDRAAAVVARRGPAHERRLRVGLRPWRRVGAAGAPAPVGVTELEAADAAPDPLGFDAVTLNV